MRRRLFLNAMVILGTCGRGGRTFAIDSKSEPQAETPMDNFVCRILKDKLNYLQLDESDVYKHSIITIQRLLKFKEVEYLLRFPWLIELLPLFHFVPKIKNNHRALERTIIGSFLLSTDFFSSGSDPSKKVNYLGYYDIGYNQTCSPFAEFH